MDSYKISITFGKKALSLPFNTLPSYDQIMTSVKKSFPEATHCSISYFDDEGDQVQVRSDMELNEAYRLSESQGTRDVQLFLEKIEIDPGNKSVNIPASSPPPHLAHSSPLQRPELSSSQRSTDYMRSQVFDFRTANNENEILDKIQSKLTEMTNVVSHLTKAKQEQTEKLKLCSEYENDISHLNNEKKQLELFLVESKQKIKDLEAELHSQKTKNRELNEQIYQMQESFKLQFKEQEETNNRINQEKEVIQGQLKEKIITLAARESYINTLRESLTKMGAQLRKENDSKSEWESKAEQYRKELDLKIGENLEMSRTVLNVKAEKETLTKKAITLERQLEQTHQERENLQQSLVQLQLQGSITGGRIPFQEETRDTSDPSGIYVVKPDSKWTKEDPDLMDARAWGKDVGTLKNIGLPGNSKTMDYEPVNVPMQPRTLPKDITESDITMLEAMGFLDLEKNIELLRKQQYNVADVVELLLKKQ